MAKTTFETNIAKLEAIIGKLEAGDVALEECVSLFEQGVALTDECLKLLDSAEQKIKLLVEKEDGSVEEAAFTAKEQ